MGYAASVPISNRAATMTASVTGLSRTSSSIRSIAFLRNQIFSSCFSARSDAEGLKPVRSSTADASSLRFDDSNVGSGGRGTAPEIVRYWIEADPPSTSKDKFTIVSYNILAKKYAAKHSDMYHNVPHSYMEWENRKTTICEELIGWNPDVICLQEVDKYFDILKVLEGAGYAGRYKKRGGDFVDGCAMFWRVDRCRVLEGESIDYKDLGLRDNVAQLCVFEMCNAESRRYLVGNIHVIYRPSRGHEKIGQIRFLSAKAHKLSEKWGKIPVVLAGDFNITPNSDIYKFVSTSKLNVMSHDRRVLSGQKSCHPDQVFGIQSATGNPFIFMEGYFKHSWTSDELKIATGDAKREVAEHPLMLKSTYPMLKKGSVGTRDINGEPLATSFHLKFIGTVDYLWYSSGIVPTKVLDTVPIDALKKTGGLPSKEVGSDHLALVAEFAFT